MPKGVFTRSEEHRKKISIKSKAYYSDPENRKKTAEITKRLWLDSEFRKKNKGNTGTKGQKRSDEAKLKMSLARKAYYTNPENLAKQTEHLKMLSPKGRKFSKESIEKRSGENHPNWKGGITPEVMKIRNSDEYKEWRTAVFERDNYTCQECGVRGGVLNADHIKPFSLYPELRFDVSNGRTLCEDCHDLIGWSLFKENNPRKFNNVNHNFLGV